MADARIAPMSDAHSAAVLSIYQAGIDEGNATFETRTPSWGSSSRRDRPGTASSLSIRSRRTYSSWVAATPVSDRCAYPGVVEHSVYVAPSARGRGVGRALLAQLIAATEAAGIWTIQSGVFPENAASLALHQRAGFRRVGRGSASAGTTGGGGTCCCSSGGVPSSSHSLVVGRGGSAGCAAVG
jgi:L-amino acid N-acyltransferase YncA